MSPLSRSASVPAEPVPPPRDRRPPLQSPVGLGALAAGQAVGGSLLCVLFPVVGAWVAASQTGATWSEALRVGADAWLLAHHTAITVTGGQVALVPLGLTLVPAAWCWAAGRRMSVALGLAGGAVPRGRTAGRALAAFTAGYALLATVVSLLAASPVARPVSGQALVGGAAVAALATGAGLLRASRSPAHPSAVTMLAGALSLPPRLRRALPAAAAATAVWVAAATVTLAVALLLGWDGVLAAHRALGAGDLGGLALTLGQLALLPVVVLWAGAWLAGPGFAVGEGTSVTPFSAELGALPAVPLLGALPSSGELPAAAAAVLLLPVLAGVVAGCWLHRRGPVGQWREVVLDAAATGVVTGVLGGLATWWASGSAGPGRMAVVGPEPLAVGLALAAEVAAGCALALAVLPRTAGQLEGLVIRLRSSSQRS